MFTSTLRLSLLATAVLAVAGTMGCRRSPERRELQYFPDMYVSPALKPQSEYAFFANNMSMRLAAPNTIHRTQYIYPFTIIEAERAGQELVNPLPISAEVINRGRKYFNIHCAVCHGAVGSGNGTVTIAYRENGMPIPPSLYTDKIREWPDGQIYHVIKMGQGQMWGYGSRITEENRWAIVHYIRALDRAANPTEADLQFAERIGMTDARRLDNPYFGDWRVPQMYLGDIVRNRPGSH